MSEAQVIPELVPLLEALFAEVKRRGDAGIPIVFREMRPLEDPIFAILYEKTEVWVNCFIEYQSIIEFDNMGVCWTDDDDTERWITVHKDGRIVEVA